MRSTQVYKEIVMESQLYIKQSPLGQQKNNSNNKLNI